MTQLLTCFGGGAACQRRPGIALAELEQDLCVEVEL